jgi:hypothetical protein
LASKLKGSPHCRLPLLSSGNAQTCEHR